MPHTLLYRNVKLHYGVKRRKILKNNGGFQAIIPEFGKTKAHEHHLSFCHTDDYTDYCQKAPKFESILLHTSGNQGNTIPSHYWGKVQDKQL